MWLNDLSVANTLRVYKACNDALWCWNSIHRDNRHCTSWFCTGSRFIAVGTIACCRAYGLVTRCTDAFPKKYNLRDRYLEIPGLINILSFGAGVGSLGIYVAIKLFGPFDYAAFMPAH
jgi:hypothetical protein